MRTPRFLNVFAAVLLAAALLLLNGCGNVDTGGSSDGSNQLPASVAVKTGTLASDSWGYTGADSVSLAAPTGAAALVAGRSLLLDASHAVVSGTTATEIEYSSDVTTLSTAQRAAAPGTLLSYLSIAIGPVATVSPALSVSVDLSASLAGGNVGIYRYDAASVSWKPVQTVTVAADGTVSFSAGETGLYGIFQ